MNPKNTIYKKMSMGSIKWLREIFKSILVKYVDTF